MGNFAHMYSTCISMCMWVCEHVHHRSWHQADYLSLSSAEAHCWLVFRSGFLSFLIFKLSPTWTADQAFTWISLSARNCCSPLPTLAWTSDQDSGSQVHNLTPLIAQLGASSAHYQLHFLRIKFWCSSSSHQSTHPGTRALPGPVTALEVLKWELCKGPPSSSRAFQQVPDSCIV